MASLQQIKPFQCIKVEPQLNELTGVLEPQPRSGHRIVVDECNIYSVGGYNPDFWGLENVDDSTCFPLFKELWKFNLINRQWVKLDTTGDMPNELASHSALLLGHHLLVFGGTGVPFGDAASNRLTLCNLHTLKWSHFKTSGKYPTKVYGQSLTIYKNCLYVFGGTTGWVYNSELHKLDFNTSQWSMVETEGVIPEGRYRHEVAIYNGRLYVFGGGRSYLCYNFEQMPVFDMESNIWSEVDTIPDSQYGFPAPRRCHSCVQLKKDAYIAGGYDGEKIFGDIWRLCLVTLRWRKLPVMLPEPVYFHSADVTPAGCMYIFGGVTVIEHVRTSSVYRVWLQPPPSLKELCWSWIIDHVPRIGKLSKEKLLQLGIPHDCVWRIAQSLEPGVCA